MSEVETVRRLMDAYARRDMETMVELCHDDLELVEWPDSPDAKTFHGRTAASKAIAEWDDVWESMRIDVRELRDVGRDRVLVVGRARGTGKGSAVEVETDAWNVVTLREGKVARIEFFIREEQALAAIREAQQRSEERETARSEEAK